MNAGSALDRRRPELGPHAVACAMVCLAAAAIGAAQQPTFRARVDLVRLDVTVTRGDQPVTGLTRADFEVVDNGVRQVVDRVLSEDVPIDTWLVLDTSRSVEGRRLDGLRAAAHAFLEGLTLRDRGALVTFTQQVALRQAPTGDLAALHRALDAIESGGSTAMNDALYTALRLQQPGEARPVVVVFSDGRDNQSWLSDEALVAATRRSDAVVYGVTTVDEPPPLSDTRRNEFPREYTALQRAAETTGGRLWRASDPKALRDAFLAVLQEVRTRYVVSYYPTGPSRPGFHHVKVKLTRTRGDVRTRAGYYVNDSPR